MFVVVFLVDSKKHIIVPEEFVFDLDEESLKNKGKNPNFRYTVFWSENALDENGIPRAEYVPDFNLVKVIDFPPIGDACYLGQVKKFYKSFESATAYKNKLRMIEQPVYNAARSREMPIPSLSFASESNQSENRNATDDVLDEDSTLSGLFDEYDENNANQETDIENEDSIHNYSLDGSTQHDAAGITSLIMQDDVQNLTHQIENEIENEEKDPLAIIVLGPDENAAFDDIFGNSISVIENDSAVETENVSENVNGALNDQHEEQNDDEIVEEVMIDGRKMITKTIIEEDGEVSQMTYEMGAVLKAQEIGYQVKLNDPISGNMPYQENVNKDRSYLVGRVGAEIKLAERVVNGLLKLNEDKQNAAKDKAFIKGLLIGTCSLKFIQEKHDVPKVIIHFIKDLFMHRIQTDEVNYSSRYLTFKDLIRQALDDIQK